MKEQLNSDAMAQVIAIVLIAVGRQLDGERLRHDLVELADAPGPNGIPGVREVVHALSRLVPAIPPGSDSPG
jgi:hypothetical protein